MSLNNMYDSLELDSDELEEIVDSPTKLYSPNQVAGGTFLGGPVGMVYFLSKNFSALGNQAGKIKAVVFGVVFIIFLSSVPFLPFRVPQAPVLIAYIVAARLISENYHISKSIIVNSKRYEMYSSWRMLLISAICFPVSLFLLSAPVVVLTKLGIWTPA